MLRIVLPAMALLAVSAPILGMSLAEQAPLPAMKQRPAVSISKDQAIDIATRQGMDRLTEIALAGDAWRVAGETPNGRVIQVDVSAHTGGVHVLEYDAGPNPNPI